MEIILTQKEWKTLLVIWIRAVPCQGNLDHFNVFSKRVSFIRSTLARDTRNKVTILGSNMWWAKEDEKKKKKKKPDNGAFVIDQCNVGITDNQQYVPNAYIWSFKMLVSSSMLVLGVRFFIC